MTTSARLFAGVFIVVGACAHEPPHVPVRASSVQQLGVPASRARVDGTMDDIVAALTARFDARGDHLVARYDAVDRSGDRLYAFKGERAPVVLGRVDTPVDGDTQGQVASYQIGSVFYARLHAAGPHSVDVLILGKPTFFGTDLCSDDDALLATFQYWCRDTRISNAQMLGPVLDGRAEAEVVRGVLLELDAQQTAEP